jgi:hypothetical protein
MAVSRVGINLVAAATTTKAVISLVMAVSRVGINLVAAATTTKVPISNVLPMVVGNKVGINLVAVAINSALPMVAVSKVGINLVVAISNAQGQEGGLVASVVAGLLAVQVQVRACLFRQISWLSLKKPIVLYYLYPTQIRMKY